MTTSRAATELQEFHPQVVLVTGGAGFIGVNLIRWMLQTVAEVSIVNLDLLTYAGNLESLRDVEEAHGARGSGRYRFVRGDIRDHALVARLLAEAPGVNALIHLAAESHVDRSIAGAAEFVSTNVVGTHTLLECVRAELAERNRAFRFLNVSTDEVYGSLASDAPRFTEQTRLAPSSPYAASKAAADCLAHAYAHTYGLPVITTRSSNNYGPFQFPEKLIPHMITRALRNEQLPLYGDGRNIRDWIHVEDHVRGLWMALCAGTPGETYHFGGDGEMANIDLVRILLAALGKPETLIDFVDDRPGHDRRYAVNHDRSTSVLGWQPRHGLANGLRETVEWYVRNEHWWAH